MPIGEFKGTGLAMIMGILSTMLSGASSEWIFKVCGDWPFDRLDDQAVALR